MKTIGIPGYRSSKQDSFGAGISHLEYITELFGNIRIIMPWEDLVEVDALYLPGGLDINPASYEETPRYRTSDTDVFKQHFNDKKLDLYIAAGTPIFGVCLGFQQLAVKFGCKLVQNMYYHSQSRDRGEYGHDIKLVTKQNKRVPVNSHHHQGVSEQTFNQEHLEILAVHAETINKQEYCDGTVEAFKHRTLPIAAVQYHPEEWWNGDHGFAQKLFESILK